MRNKSNILFLFFLTVPMLFFAQDQLTSQGYLFDVFENGKVVYKKGGTAQGLFNYDAVGEKLLFMANGEVMELTNPSIIDHVDVGGRVFEHVGRGVFYEKVSGEGMPFYIKWKSNIESDGKRGAYGTVSKISSISTKQSLDNGITAVEQLNLAEDYSVRFANTYYIKQGNKYKRFNSFDALAKLFKGHENDIKKYVEAETADFKNLENIQKIVAYCSQFVKE